MLTVTLLSLVLTGLPFFNQEKFTGKVEESTEHSNDWLVPAVREELVLSIDTRTLGTEEKI